MYDRGEIRNIPLGNGNAVIFTPSTGGYFSPMCHQVYPNDLGGSSQPLHFNMMRFRLGCWYLRANDLKLKSTNIPRRERVCLLCLRVRHLNLVDDEEHVVFECPFECVRNKYKGYFSGAN